MRITILSLLLLLPFLLSAQRKTAQNIFLKNKSIFKGKVNEYVPGKGVYFETSDAIYFFEDEDIDSIVGSFNISGIENNVLEGKVLIAPEVGVIPGNSSEVRSAPFSFLLTAKYHMKNGLMIGAGAGLEFWQENYMPTYLSVDYLFRDSGFSPLIGLKAGYTIAISKPSTDYGYYYGYWPQYQIEEVDPQGGVFINPTFGFVRMLHPNYGYSISFGYRYQNQQYIMKGDQSSNETINVAVSRLSIHVGFIFN